MVPKSGDALMIFSLSKGTSLEDAAKGNLQQYGLTLVESKKENINDMPAILMVADQKQEGGTLRVLLTLIHFNGNIYTFTGISELSKFSTFQSTFLSTMRNFQELKDGEKLNRKPDVVRIKTLPQAMTLENAFRHFNMPSEKFEELAILNGMKLKDPLSGGTLIKVIGR